MRVARTWQISRFQSRPFTVLAMETSADDTAVAIVDGSKRKILSNVVMKQHSQHKEYGGIHPNVAIQWHQRNLPHALKKALHHAKLGVQDVDGIAFTRGPGMAGCLSVSVNAAQSLAAALDKPIVGVHHLQAHVLVAELTNHGEFPGYPFLTLLISGGHTMIVLATSCRKFKILATSLDIAIGNAFDKAARMLKIQADPNKGYGAALESFCLGQPLGTSEFSVDKGYPFPPLKYSLPNPWQKDIFSFTGLTAAVQRVVESRELNPHERWSTAVAFQEAVISQLELKLKGAIRWCQKNDVDVSSLVVSGGVASNTFLRKRLRQFLDGYASNVKHLVFPPIEYCTDNATMIGWASMHRFLERDHDEYGIQPLPKWSIETLA